MSDVITCSNCGLKYDPDQPDCTHCHFNIVERNETNNMSKDKIKEEFDL
ncbi:hypothetical protein [Nitrosopumilus sp.]